MRLRVLHYTDLQHKSAPGDERSEDRLLKVSSSKSLTASETLYKHSFLLQDLLRITASWLQTNSDTGRISVENPNLQCVPKPRSFTVPTTQLDGSRVFEANLR